MDRELWLALYELVKEAPVRGKGWLYSTADIVMAYFWAVVHDRPMCWTTDKRNWPEDLCPRPLPSQSQLSRRLRGADVVELMTFVENTFVAMIGADRRLIRIIDGKPLEVSNVSKDPDAGYGRSAGGKHKGYKWHVVHAGGPTPLAWGLAPMNTSEKVMAAKLIPTLPGEGYLLGDAEFDTNPLHDLAHDAGHQIVAPKHGRTKGLGHRRHSPYRLRSIALLQSRFGRALYRYRRQIEREFGTLVSFGGGLTCLPAWVRRFNRVRNWLHAKILINAVRWFRTNGYNLLGLLAPA
jgi:hypothetical protein